MSGKRKKIISAVLTAAIIAGATAGISMAVRATTSDSTVTVYPASGLNYGGYYDYGTDTMDGQVATDASQDVYVNSSETVSRVEVKEGQQVKEGDVLLIFDTKKTEIGLEQEQINNRRLQLEIEAAEKNLDTLSRLKPVSHSDGGDIIPVDPVNPVEPDSQDEEEPVYSGTITKEAVEAFTGDADGTAESPYLFRVEPDDDGYVTVDPPFTEALREKGEDAVYFVLQKFDENDVLQSAFLADAYRMSTDGAQKISLTPVVSSEGLTAEKIAEILSSMDLTDEERELIRKAAGIEVPAPTEAPEPTVTPEPTATPEPTTTPAPSDGDDSQNSDSDQAGEYSSMEHAGGENGRDAVTAAVRRIIPVKASGETMALRPVSGTTADAFLTAEISSSQTSEGGDGTDSGSSDSTPDAGSITLIPSNAEYTADELKQAKEDTQKQIDDITLDLRESDLKIAQTQKDLDEGTVRAKMNGVVRTVGDPAKPPTDGSAFLTVTGSEGMYIRSAVSEKNLSALKEGDTVTVTSWTTGNTYDAVVKDISPYPDTSDQYSGDSSESYYPFTAYIDSADADLSAGDYLQVTMTGTAENTDDGSGFYLYKAFIREEAGQKYVWLRDGEGRLKKQNVTTGALSGEGWEILSGVTQDDYIAFPYGKNLKDGAKTKEGTIDELYSAMYS